MGLLNASLRLIKIRFLMKRWLSEKWLLSAPLCAVGKMGSRSLLAVIFTYSQLPKLSRTYKCWCTYSDGPELISFRSPSGILGIWMNRASSCQSRSSAGLIAITTVISPVISPKSHCVEVRLWSGYTECTHSLWISVFEELIAELQYQLFLGKDQLCDGGLNDFIITSSNRF